MSAAIVGIMIGETHEARLVVALFAGCFVALASIAKSTLMIGLLDHAPSMRSHEAYMGLGAESRASPEPRPCERRAVRSSAVDDLVEIPGHVDTTIATISRCPALHGL